jgi:hypothetical protein
MLGVPIILNRSRSKEKSSKFHRPGEKLLILIKINNINTYKIALER